MSYWAELDTSNKVIRVTKGDNNDPAGDEGYQWLIDNLGGRWIKTSFNGKIRKNFASVGMIYDEEKDWFYPPQPYQGWILNKNATWIPPVNPPVDGRIYVWSDFNLRWELAE